MLHAFTVCAKHNQNNVNSWAISTLLHTIQLTQDAWHTVRGLQNLWEQCSRQSAPKQAFIAMRNLAWRQRSAASMHISEHVSTSLLPDDVGLTDAMGTIADLLEQSRVLKKQNHHKFLSADQEPWSHIARNVADLEALMAVGEAVSCCETGFISCTVLMEIVEELWEGPNGCPWLRKMCTFREKLLRYLPVVSVQVPTGFMVGMHPPGGQHFLTQITQLASSLHSAASETQERLRAMPMRDYLRSMGCERDRRVFKGVIAQLTSPTFCKQQFNWQHDSIARIQEDLSLVDSYLSDLNNLLSSFEYCTETSAAKRRAMRRKARVSRALAGFLGAKHGGRPSKLRQYS